MQTTAFYSPPDRISGERLTLPPDEAAHAHRVLRHRRGDEIVVVDGMGGWYRVAIDSADSRHLSGHIVARRCEVGEPPYQLTVGLSLLKQEKRFAHFLEKATELGVSTVLPLITARTEKYTYRPSRATGVMIAAMKQCGRSRCVAIGEPVRLEDYLQSVAGTELFVCHEAADSRDFALMRQLSVAKRPQSLAILIGPEGGFSDGELDAVMERGGRLVSLGDLRLRAETAAIAASAGVMLYHNAMNQPLHEFPDRNQA